MKFRENGEITLSFTDIGKPCPSREFLTLQTCFNGFLQKYSSRENFRIYSTFQNRMIGLQNIMSTYFFDPFNK